MAQVKISVMLKPTLLDAQGRVVQHALLQLGYDVESVRIGRAIELSLADGPDLPNRVEAMCDKLLANPVIEDYRYEVVER